MINLLISIANWQLPTWLSFGSVATGFTAVVGLILNIKKTGLLKDNVKTTGDAQISLLGNIVNMLTSIAQLNNKALSIVENQDTLIEKVDSLEKQNELQYKNIGLFMLDTFQRSNMSDDDKLANKLKYDELFLTNNLSTIEELKTNQKELETVLSDKDAEILKLNEKLLEYEETVKNTTIPVKKTRRV